MLTAGRAGRRPEGPLTPLLLGEYRLSRCARGLPRNPVACDVAPRVVRCPCRTHVTCTYRDLHQTRANIVITPSPRGFSLLYLYIVSQPNAESRPASAPAGLWPLATVAPPSAACTPIPKVPSLGRPTAAIAQSCPPPQSTAVRTAWCNQPLPIPPSPIARTQGASAAMARQQHWRAAMTRPRTASATSRGSRARAPPGPPPSLQPSRP